ncbi:1,4-beta-D-glucan cellobiohydrolase C [Eremomyces bilateralis CBS 781.70]|uniref:Glucanase n=1 Tax=Eremomyces bilateralis CBS 781.70 TaxID=1392243 RepID=A0A6G1FYP3_9PEZI|nr:1,4-beta-D-glucan cellobiohydrolase C [Eremomyces bilateralis CBS 781.70]KAF1810821.1 1,4-beta-D-glucan cellobiohydrolase C [Eremomyces bilateralis CBS 781.70]
MKTSLFSVATVFASGAVAVALPEPRPEPTAAPSPVAVEASTTTAAVEGNPFAGYELYVNPYYSSEVHSIAIPSLQTGGKTALIPKASAAAKVPSFVWLDTQEKVSSVKGYAEEIQKQNAAGQKVAFPLVVYNLPDRDCAALASNGELAIADDGVEKYKAYIDSIVTEVKAFSDLRFILIIEPDSLANLITNLGTSKCAGAADAYKEGINYAIKNLALPNVSMYLDAAHGGWLGWPANLSPAAQLFAQVYKDAGSPPQLRGLVTNVANYNAFSIAQCPSYTQGNENCDEKKYINSFAPVLKENGFPAQFIVDTGRNGKQPTGQQIWGDWCNIKDTGFGARPTAETGDPLVDAFVWVKPGGESDGTSDSSATRFDGKCASGSSLTPAPEAGNWFQAYFEQLLTNANPPL